MALKMKSVRFRRKAISMRMEPRLLLAGMTEKGN
jgi:hypothetical protein